MASKRKRRQNQSGSILGAVVIESLAVVVILGLFFTVQEERSRAFSVEELVKPKMVFAEARAAKSNRYWIRDFTALSRDPASRRVKKL